MNTVWQQLGIDETCNKKAIKQAYATKIKHIRPDEKPDEFQQLHSAYKTAIRLAQCAEHKKNGSVNIVGAEFGLETKCEDVNIEAEKSKDRYDLSTNTDWNADSKSHPGLKTTESTIPDNGEYYRDASAHARDKNNEPNPILDTFETQRSDDHKVLDQLMNVVEQKISDNDGHSIAAWTFLAEQEKILDSRFSAELGRKILNRFIQYYNEREFIPRGDFIIGLDVLSYLDAIFQWCENGEIDLGVFINRQGQDVFGRLINQETRYSLARGNHGNDPIAGLRGAKSIKKSPRARCSTQPKGDLLWRRYKKNLSYVD